VVKNGGKILVVGVADEKIVTDIGSVMFRELKLIGCMMYNNGDFKDAIDIMARSRLDLSGLVTKVFPLREIETVFPEVIGHNNLYIKCVLQP
jgi:L-iditol 2-dehydrogenase/threonine 3-dehydrogenase